MRSRVPALVLLATVLLVPTVARASHGETMLDAAVIQSRIDAASPGAVVVVPSGEYHGNLVVDRAITLRGEGRPLIHGDGTGSVILVSGDGAVVEGFGVANSAVGPVGGPAGIRIEADGVVVQDNIVEDTYMGIALFGSKSAEIVDNVVLGREGAAIQDEGHATDPNAGDGVSSSRADTAGTDQTRASSGHVYGGDGISLWNCTGVLVRGNLVDGARDGVYMSFGTDILIDTNHVRGSRYAIHSMFAKNLTAAENLFEHNLSGVVLMYGGPVLLLRNEVRDNTSASTGFGMLLKDVFGVDAVENAFVGNRIGIQIDGPAGDMEHRIVVHGNTIAMNQFGVALYPSAHAFFYRNSFVENTVQVVALGNGVAGKNTWTYEGAGNYWSNYRGYDLGGEGLGDTPHHEGGTVERLMARAPVLQALASGPAFSLLRAVEDRWIEHRPVVTDTLPLMRPESPALDDGATGSGASVALGAAGLLVSALAIAILVAFRRPLRRGRVSHAV